MHKPINKLEKTTIENQTFLEKLELIYGQDFIKSTNCEIIGSDSRRIVYAINTEDGIRKNVIIINQTNSELGMLSQEFSNLSELALYNKNIVAPPKCYYQSNNKEGYLSPYYHYHYQIMYKDGSLGIFNHITKIFKPFNSIEKYIINTSIIANLIRLYDEDNKMALAACHFDEGDFVLDTRENLQCVQTTINKIKLISARKLINIELLDYIKLLKKELCKEKEDSFIVNCGQNEPFEKYEINDGILLGLDIRNR